MAYATTMLRYAEYKGNGRNEWFVETTDNISTSVASAYLNPSISVLKVNDLVWFYCSDGVALRRVSSVTTNVTVAALG